MTDPYASFDALTFDRPAPKVLRITLDGPGLNSVGHDAHRQLADVWLAVDRDPDTHVALIQGAGKGFSAGGSFELLDDLMTDPAVRLRIMREARDHIKQTYNVDAVEFLKDATPDRLAEWGRYHQRAILFGVLSKVETKENADGEWVIDQLPDEWKTITTFDRAIPGTLYDEWLQTALDLNPGQFLELPGDSEKKFVRVSSNRLLN